VSSYLLNSQSDEITCPVEDMPNGFAFKYVGEVTYKDFFNEQHSTTFCFENKKSLKTVPPDEGELQPCLFFEPREM